MSPGIRHLRPLSQAALICSLFLQAACGGGGGGGDSNASNPPAVAGNQAPLAVFTLSTTSGFAPVNVSFNASSSRDPDGSLTSYVWDFGDGSAAGNGVTVSHQFTDPGSYSVSLTVTDNQGLASSAFASVRARGVQLSGTLAILPSSAIDSDTNDRLSNPVANNDFTTAQSLPNPVRLGGYVNLPGTGEASGNLFSNGDTSDFYAVNLTGNELIALSLGDAAADLDLRLWDNAQVLVDASLGTGVTESLTVPGPGAYFVEVVAYNGPTNIAGASNYVLSINQDPSGTGVTTRRSLTRLSDDFMPGEVIFTARRDQRRAQIHTKHRLTPRARAGRATRATLVDARNPARNDVSAVGLSARQRTKYATLIALKQLSMDAEVESAEPNALVYPLQTPNDQFYGLQWHYPAISLPGAWDISIGAAVNPVIVAVLDTGILPQHPDIDSQLVAGYDFISSAGRARDGNGIDPDPTDEGDLAFGASSSFHGTHVAGTVGAESNNGLGVAGVAWLARIMPLRVLGVDGGTSFDVAQAIYFAAGLANASNTLPQRRADVINMSLGSSGFSQTQAAAIDAARAAGVIVIASAGNEASSSPSYPAAYDGVVSVSATTIDDTIASYSNFGLSIDIAAPGGFNATDNNGDGIGDGVISTLGDDSNAGPLLLGYGSLSGTSMAAPHVAGVAALMKAVHPALTPLEFDAALSAGDLTDDLGAPGWDSRFGHGRLNAQKALLAAQSLASGGGSDPGPILAASNYSVSFGALTEELHVQLRNVGTGSIVINSFTSSEPWLSVFTTANTDANGLGEYRLNVDRTGLQPGAYRATLSFEPLDPAISSISLAITLQVANINPAADAGLHYVIAVDENGATVGNTAVVSVSNGSYSYVLDDLPAGRYRLFAGSDMNDNNFLCDGGESCGAFRTLDAPEILEVDPQITPSVSGLDFVTEFRVVFSSNAQSASDPTTEPGDRAIGFEKTTIRETPQ